MANINVGRKSGFIIRGGVRKRETVWFGGTAFNQSLATTTSVALVLSLNAAALAFRPFTVIRTRGLVRVNSDQVGATEDYGASFGMAVVSEQAVAIGVTAVPTPTVDSSSDLWYVYEFLIGQFQFLTSAGVFESGVERIIDSKAMRKVEDGQDLVGVVEGPGSGLAPTGSQIAGFTRILVKLH